MEIIFQVLDLGGNYFLDYIDGNNKPLELLYTKDSL